MHANAFTVDVEDAVNIVMRDHFDIERPPTEAVVANTEKMLGVLDSHATRGTFFVLGEVARSFPSLVKRIADCGHEVGVHGFRHRQFFKMNVVEAMREVGDAKRLLEDILGREVYGHRAPAFSVRPDTAWALQVIADAGFLYDSSVMPCPGRRYGWPGFNRDIHRMNLADGRSLIEAPMSVVRLCGKNMPVCGGGYLQHLPYWFTEWAMRRVSRDRPVIVYVHPYEMDRSQPPAEYAVLLKTARLRTRLVYRLRERGRNTVERKLERLLSGHEFLPLIEVIKQRGDGINTTSDGCRM